MEHTVAGDAIAVVVHPSNPVNRLTIPQLSDIFSGKITNWLEVGGEDRPIVLLSRESNSGTHVFFLEEVVRRGDGDDKTLFSPDTLLMPSSEGIIRRGTPEPQRHRLRRPGVCDVRPEGAGGGPCRRQPYVMPTVETVKNGTYPIARPLYIYTAGEPQGAIAGYLEWITGPEGQAIVLGQGFVPLD